MEKEKKPFWQSKRFWGLVASAIGFIAVLFSQFFGVDIADEVKAVGTVLQVFGLPFTFYGAAVADKPLGMSKQ